MGGCSPCSSIRRRSTPSTRRSGPGVGVDRTVNVDLAGDERFRAYLTDPFTEYTPRDAVTDDVDVVVVGVGLSGVIQGVELRKAGVERIRFVDKAGGFGGTWYWNRYPGLMCDVESYIYMPMLEEMGTIPTMKYASRRGDPPPPRRHRRPVPPRRRRPVPHRRRVVDAGRG